MALEIGKLDDVIHGRLRLGVMAYLANAGVAEFTEIKNALEVTQGNLSVQLRKLEDAGYIEIEKNFVNRKPVTRARLTSAGRKAFKNYLDVIGKLITDST